MNLERSSEHLVQETPPAEQPARNMETPPAFVRQESAEATGDVPPKIERGSTLEKMSLGRTMESGPRREVYRPDPPKDMRSTPQERLKAALDQEQRIRSHPGTGIR